MSDLWDTLHKQRIESELRGIRDAVERQGQPAERPGPHEPPIAALVLGVVALFVGMPLGSALLSDLGFTGWWYVLGWLTLAVLLFAFAAGGVTALLDRKRHRAPPPWTPPSRRDPRP